MSHKWLQKKEILIRKGAKECKPSIPDVSKGDPGQWEPTYTHPLLLWECP